ncbi:PiggyBac transposable element-derived protein 2 [Portunus trituberculatus]|uniref:PiggyBac transposable element-derived protein 2 n=1 Tax=Portunus trituberculatus TaxID=210409 RepID=A0A5B7G886_PORTR|nr:PiggyBac transposable element-derived protein 2 [Portunus trituberculatus]
MREGVWYHAPALEGLGEKLEYTQRPQSRRKRTAQTLSLHKALALHDTHCGSTVTARTVWGIAGLHSKSLVRRDNWRCLGGGGGPMAAGENWSQGGVPKNHVTVGSCYSTAPCGLWIWSIHGAASLRGSRNRLSNCSRFCILLKVTERGVEPTDQDMWGNSSLCGVAASSVQCCAKVDRDIIIASHIINGYVSPAQGRMYWEKREDTRNPLVMKAMSRNTFDDIMHYIHFANNKKPKTAFGRRVSCQALWAPSLKQFLKGKPTRLGFKVWVLGISDGKMIHCEPYGCAKTVYLRPQSRTQRYL